ncbi:RdgB/HAM1 family non-canonical purine NTP pyrophosphatase [Ancylobacter sonchi]|uniref:RdgB/HAM1 family non-canonical purine NTP pyrophosphatase n=1 Tax=Ancylobacter sonchi TaxID=1937790 RepID=UPI001BD374AB|nr:RdgB/HAM1 family non-canonical purine NTP pyrophosphatase [Ancylobacter sonchi]MBS7533698.1 RdgB/HAM1 family non-canonical purine NTP pyrophosphatase [Ancylobacter sonchi]
MDEDRQEHRRLVGRVVIATHNPGKLIEMRGLMEPYGVELVSAGDLGLPEPEETGLTFEENARIKARAACEATGLPAFADDSGLCVEALGGAPGLYTARWAGPGRDWGHAMARVEEELRKVDAVDPVQRRAYFISALCVAWPDGHVEDFEGVVSGEMIWPPRGDSGHGYDPMFLPDGSARTFGEMNGEEKHAMPPLGRGGSHRARAFIKLAEACFGARFD